MTDAQNPRSANGIASAQEVVPMQTPWTPGPWSWEPDLAPLKVLAGRTDVVCEFAKVPPAANARLIEAAPELAEALDDLALVFRSTFGDEPELVRARALLSRIRGEA